MPRWAWSLWGVTIGFLVVYALIAYGERQAAAHRLERAAWCASLFATAPTPADSFAVVLRRGCVLPALAE